MRRGGNAITMSKPRSKKTVYADQPLFCCQKDTGEWYVAAETKDPECEKFGKMLYLGKLESFPAKVTTGEVVTRGKKSRFILDKEAVKQEYETSFGCIFSEDESPWSSDEPEAKRRKTKQKAEEVLLSIEIPASEIEDLRERLSRIEKLVMSTATNVCHLYSVLNKEHHEESSGNTQVSSQ